MIRGEVMRVRLPKGVGHEQAGARYAVVLQADEFAEHSTVVIAPTSRSRASTTFRPEVVVLGERTRVLTEQLGAVDRRRLGDSVGRLTPEELGEVDDALRVVLAL
jgi:mRNA interferase MazF